MRLLNCLFFCLWVTGPATAHEFWIEPQEYQVESGDAVIANLKNGEKFNGGSLAWFDRRIIRAEGTLNGSTFPLTGRAGDLPAITYTPEDAGLFQIIHQTTLDTLTYRDPKKFANFVKHKDLGDSALKDQSYPSKEGYSRFAKSLIAIGEGLGEDTAKGLEIELIALDNPYDHNVNSALQVQLIYQNAPRPETQIEIFEKAPDGTVHVTTTDTDASGVAKISVKPNHSYLLDAVILRKPSAALAAERGIEWETLWASLTFAVPAGR